MVPILKGRISSLGANSLLNKGRQNIFDKVDSLANVSIPLKTEKHG